MWIDHKQAVIVIVLDKGGKIRHVRLAEGSSKEGVAEDVREQRRLKNLSCYYNRIIAHIRDAGSILIWRPGDEKGELGRRLGAEQLGERIVGIETMSPMINRQIVARVRRHFRK